MGRSPSLVFAEAEAQMTRDGRVTEVFITGEGEEMVKKIRAIASRIYNIAFHDLTAAEIATLNALLARVFRNLAIQPHP